jgi:hypothetical protein
MSSGWNLIKDNTGNPIIYYNESYNSFVQSIPTSDGMTDTLDALNSTDDLFFDDDPININQVAQEIAKTNKAKSNEGSTISLKTIFCPPGKLQLLSLPEENLIVDVIGSEMIQLPSWKYSNAINYADAKFKGGNLFATLLQFHPDIKNEVEVGRGLTIVMMDKIIEHVSKETTDPRCKYYFDFDKLFSLVEVLILSLFHERYISQLQPKPTEDELLLSYAKYLFSDYIGDEPTNGIGRMAKLQDMFEIINKAGIGVYIVTNNPSAGRSRDMSNERRLFIKLIKILFPHFTDDHLICSETNDNKNKGVIIVKINDPSTLSKGLADIFPKGGMTRTKHRKSKRRYKVSSAHTANKKKQRNSKRYKNKRPFL